MRDWFPLSAMGPFGDLTDLMLGREDRVGRAQVRLPPELRHRDRAARQQEDEADGAARSGARPRGAALRHPGDHRRRAVARRDHGRARPSHSAAGSTDATRRRASALSTLVRQFVSQTGARGRRSAPTRKTRPSSSGASSSWPACGSRISSTTTSGAPRCASSRTARRRARSASALTTPASAGGRSSRRCTRPRRSPTGIERVGATPSMQKTRTSPWPQPLGTVRLPILQ